MRVTRLTLVTLAVTGLWQLAVGLYIPAKAAVAQVLLQKAWDRTLSGEQQVKPWPWADTWPVARLRQPEQGIDLIILAGANGRTLAFGPGHLDESVLPGRIGNSILAGHRDTHFAFLKELVTNDRFTIETADGIAQWYRVIDAFVYDVRDDTRLRLNTDEPVISLVTCFPFDAVVPGGPLRYVVFATPVGARLWVPVFTY